MKRLKRIGMPLLTLLLVLAVWEGCVHVFDIDLYILPAPSNILQALFANRDILWLHSMVTLQEAVIGLLIAISFNRWISKSFFSFFSTK